MPKGQKIDAEVLKTRRLEARRLLDDGVGQAEVARRLKISRQSVSRWARLKPRALAKVRRQGRKSKFDDRKRSKLRTLLLAGPVAAGFANELWTVPRVRRIILQRFGLRFSTVHVWRLLRQLEFSPQRTEGRARERDEATITAWKTRDWPRLKKKARRERRTLIFLDESGLSQRPRRASTWAPRGQTPILTFNFNWKSLSAIAGLTARDFYFQLHEGSIKSPQVIGFLQALHRQVPGKVLLLWDGAPIHRSHAVGAYLQTQTHWLHVERLPAYAPELNPVEYLWAYWKKNELANFCPKNIWELSHAASQALKRIRRRKRRLQLIAAFFAQAELF